MGCALCDASDIDGELDIRGRQYLWMGCALCDASDIDGELDIRGGAIFMDGVCIM